MSTRADERLRYRELAKQGARVVRSVQPEGFTRLAELAPARDAMTVEMAFSLRDGRAWAAGSVDGVLGIECQRCLERFDRPLRATFELCIVADPDLASELARELPQGDVLMAESDSVTIAQVVEDELILCLPERACVEEPCPAAPPLCYPAEGTEATDADDNPFRVLSELKRG
jgi:uncharacterized protein